MSYTDDRRSFYNTYLSNLRQDLQNTFTRLKLNGVILKQRGSLAIATDRIEMSQADSDQLKVLPYDIGSRWTCRLQLFRRYAQACGLLQEQSRQKD